MISCLKEKNVFEPKSFSEVNNHQNIQKIFNCIGGGISMEKYKENRKCVEMSVGGICPFNGIHTLCQRCRCVEARPNSTR